MKKIFALMFSLVLAVVMAASAVAQPIPITVEKVEVDGFLLSELGNNVRDLERGEEFDIKIFLQADASIPNKNNETNDVQVLVFISGFEQSRSEPIADETRAFDLQAGHSVVKKLTLELPERADEDTYRLRIVVADRNSDPIVMNFRIKIEPSDTLVVIRDLELSPEDNVKAGRAILATVRIKNLGDSDEDDVKIKVSIPELGISAPADFIDELEDDESATSEEFFLKTSACDTPGVYNVKAVVTFDEGDEQVVMTRPITVTAGNCEIEQVGGQAQVSGKTTISFSTGTQDVSVGGPSATYPITLTNGGTTTRVFMLSVAGDWANVKISPSNVLSVRAGTTQTAFVSVSANQGTAAGERLLSVAVKDSAGNTLQDLTLRANIVSSASTVSSLASLRNVASVALVALVVILVIVGLLLAFRRTRGPEGEESQTYY